MKLYEIQWIGPPRAGGAEIIDRVTDRAPEDQAVKEHARHLFATIREPGARSATASHWLSGIAKASDLSL
jgi:hypothetical protein